MTSHFLAARIRTASAHRWLGRPATRRPRLSLYRRVLMVNTVLLFAAVLALVLSPATVSFPLASTEGVVLVVGVLLVAVANAVLLKVSFRNLTAVARRMESIDLLLPQGRLPERGGSEVRALIAGFNTMLEHLEAERRDSNRRTLTAIEDERRRVGRELHDEIGQRLTGTLLQLTRLGDDLPSPMRRRLDAIQEEQRQTLDQVGALAWQLRPALLDDLGLISALDALVDSLDPYAAPTITADLPPWLPRLTPEVELVLYRIAQEALTNALRHADAGRITLELRAARNWLMMQVNDDGRGISPAQLGGPGIRGMRERALLIGARIYIGPIDPAGTRVCASLRCALIP